jgi:hypothetical protein
LCPHNSSLVINLDQKIEKKKKPYKFFASNEVSMYLVNHRLLKSPKLPIDYLEGEKLERKFDLIGATK